MELSKIEVNKLSRRQITKVLFGDEKDDGDKGDCIFTYGGRGIERAGQLQLTQVNLAPKIKKDFPQYFVFLAA